jgi:hypothetical protein
MLRGRCNNFAGTNAYRVLIALALVVLCAACLADPRRTQMTRLFDQLVEAQVSLREGRTEPACGNVGDVATKLSGEPGLVELRDVWPSLRAATDALQAVCGQATLLAQPFDATPAMLQARERWQAGRERELRVACDELKRASAELERRVGC